MERVSAVARGYPVLFVNLSEQHGCLRIYWKSENLPRYIVHAIEEAVARAEARSTVSCAACGNKARLFSCKGRLITACPDHAEGVAVPARTGVEGHHFFLRRVKDSDVVACVRYDFDLDRFVNVDPNLVGLDVWY